MVIFPPFQPATHTMSTPASGIVCRRATAEDYEAVLDINRNLYSGMDPVPGTFMASLEDSRMIMHVLEKDKRIVRAHTHFFSKVATRIG